jgi:ammonia channel protein AmtB
MALTIMVYFQLVFASITVVLKAGAFLGNMKFYAWMVFVPLLALSYIVGGCILPLGRGFSLLARDSGGRPGVRLLLAAS